MGLVGLTLAGLAILAVPWVHSVWFLATLFSVSFFCNDLMIGPAWAACADVGERYAGTISGAMNMTGQFFGAAGMHFAGCMLQRGTRAIAVFPVRLRVRPGGALLAGRRRDKTATSEG